MPEHGKEGWAIFIVIVGVTIGLVYAAAHGVGEAIALREALSDTGPSVDTSDWQTYNNPNFNFAFQYPPDWQISTAGLSAQTPFIALGDPLEGTSTYVLEIFVEPNSGDLSSGEYVHQLLSNDRAEDAANASSGPVPQITPQYQKNFVLDAGSYNAYELSGVFEFDHNAEQIYVAHSSTVLRFDFPVAEENPNINLPVAHNATAHAIVDTLMFGN